MSIDSSLMTGGFSHGGNSDVSGTNIPLILVTAHHDKLQGHTQTAQILPKLPSHKYRHSCWYELRQSEITGDKLKAPRVRQGPAEKEKIFYTVRNENNEALHHSRKGKERKDYRDKTENWESTQFCNLSYQALGHNYQKENFMRTLKRLMRVQELHLIDNGLQNLSSLHFNACTYLNLNRNFLSSFKNLPHVPCLEILNLSHNALVSFEGLEKLSKTPVRSLCLTGNPLCFDEHYRQRVFYAIPRLEVLDELAKMPEDGDPPPKGSQATNCVIS